MVFKGSGTSTDCTIFLCPFGEAVGRVFAFASRGWFAMPSDCSGLPGFHSGAIGGLFTLRQIFHGFSVDACFPHYPPDQQVIAIRRVDGMLPCHLLGSGLPRWESRLLCFLTGDFTKGPQPYFCRVVTPPLPSNCPDRYDPSAQMKIAR